MALAVLAAPAGAAAAAHAQGGGTLAGPPQAGGAQYGAPIVRAHPGAPGRALLPRRPARRRRAEPARRSRCASTRRARRTVSARVVLLPLTETGSIVRVDLGTVHVGQRVVATWPAGTTLAPGRYRVRLHVRGLRGTVLARKASTPGLTTLTVRAPEPAPAPLPDAAGHVFPVAGPHGYGDGLRRAAQRLLAPGPGHHGRRGRARRRARRRRRSPSPTTRRRRPATTSSRRAPTATTTSSPTARRARSSSRPSRPCSPASRCATSAARATRPGRICTSRLGRADGGSMGARTPSTRCRCSRAGTSAQRQPQLAGDAGELGPRPRGQVADAGADELRDLGGQDARAQAGGKRAGSAGGCGRSRRGRRRAQVRGRVVGEHERAAVDAGAGDELAVLRERVGAVAACRCSGRRAPTCRRGPRACRCARAWSTSRRGRAARSAR